MRFTKVLFWSFLILIISAWILYIFHFYPMSSEEIDSIMKMDKDEDVYIGLIVSTFLVHFSLFLMMLFIFFLILLAFFGFLNYLRNKRKNF